VFLALSPIAAVSALLLFILCVVYWRFVSLGSVAAAAAMPLLIYFLWAPHHAPPPSVTIGAFAAAMLIVYKHDANIQRLVEGREPRFAFSKESKDGKAERAASPSSAREAGARHWRSFCRAPYVRTKSGFGLAMPITRNRSRAPKKTENTCRQFLCRLRFASRLRWARRCEVRPS
jgi:hypothetical protein